MTRVLCLVALLVMSACADRIDAPIVPDALGVGTAQPVYVGTSRSEENGVFGIGRSADMSYLRTIVSLPPAREPGTITDGRARPNPSKDFVLAEMASYPNASSFGRAIQSDSTGRSVGGDITVYVHGFNNSFTDAAFRMAQLSHDLDLSGPVVSYAWSSRGNPLGYQYDTDSALFARDGLAEMLRAIERHGPKQIILVGHSMGSRLVMETLRQLELTEPGWASRSLSGVLLISPDVNVDVFRAQARAFETWPQPFVIFASQNDKLLRISAAIRGEEDRLGNLQDVQQISDLPIVLIDVTGFEDGDPADHFIAGSSAGFIRLIRAARDLDDRFLQGENDASISVLGSSRRIGNLTKITTNAGLR